MKGLKKLLVVGLLLVGTLGVKDTVKAEIAKCEDPILDTNPYNGESFKRGHGGEGSVASYGVNFRVGVSFAKDTNGSWIKVSKDATESDLNNFMKERYVPVDDQFFHIYILPRCKSEGLFNDSTIGGNLDHIGGYEKIDEPGSQWYFVQNTGPSGQYRYPQSHSTTKNNTCYFIGQSGVSDAVVFNYLYNFYAYAGNDYTDFLYTVMVANNTKPLSSSGQSLYDWMCSSGILSRERAESTLRYIFSPDSENSIDRWSGASGLNRLQNFENANFQYFGDKDRQYCAVINTIWYNACMARLGSDYGKDVSPYIDNITDAILPTSSGYQYVNTAEVVFCTARSYWVTKTSYDDGVYDHYLGQSFPRIYDPANAEHDGYAGIYAALNDVQFNDNDITIGEIWEAYDPYDNYAKSAWAGILRDQYCKVHLGLTEEQLKAAIPDPVFTLHSYGKSQTGTTFASTPVGREFLWNPWYGDGSHSMAYFMTVPQYFGICFNCDITRDVYVTRLWSNSTSTYTNTLELMRRAVTSHASADMRAWNDAMAKYDISCSYLDWLYSNSPLVQLFAFNTSYGGFDVRHWKADPVDNHLVYASGWDAAMLTQWYDDSSRTNVAMRYWGKHVLTEAIPGARIVFNANGEIEYVSTFYAYPTSFDGKETFLAWSLCTQNSCSLSVTDVFKPGCDIVQRGSSSYVGKAPQFGFCCFSPHTPVPAIRNLTGGESSFLLKSLTQGDSAIQGDSWDTLGKIYGYISNDNINIYNNLVDIETHMDNNSWKIVQVRKYFGMYEGYVDLKLIFNKFSMDDYSDYSTGWRSINYGDKYRGNTTMQYRTTTASPSGVTYTINDGSTIRIPYQDVYWLFFQAKWQLVNYDTITGKLSPCENIVEGYDIAVAISDRPAYWVGLKSKTGAQAMSATRTVQYFHASTRNQPIDAYAEVKDGDKPGKETYEAMAGVPSTEQLHFTFGGTSYITEIKYTSKYNKDIGDKKHCNYLEILSYEVWALDKADVINLGSFSPTNDATASIDDGKLNIRYTDHRVVPQGSGYRVYGDTLEYIDETGNWKPLVMTYYDVGSGYFSGNHYDDIRGTATEKLLCVVNNGIFGDHTEPSTNQKTTENAPFERHVPDGYFLVVGYNGKAATLDNPSDWGNKFTYVKPSTKIDVTETTANGLRDNIKAKTSYKKLHGTDNTVYTKDTKYIPGSGYSVNPIIIHDPVAINTVNITPEDFIVSYNRNFDSANPEVTEPADQRVNAGAAGPVAYTSANKVFIEYDFALGVNFLGDFSNNIADNYGLANPIRERGLGLNSAAINTTRWISKAEIQFPIAVKYNGTLYPKNTWIELPMTENAKNTGKETYTGFSIPLSESEINQGQIQLRVTAINAGDNPNSLDITNKERNTVYVANHLALKKAKVDVVGHIGGLEMLDTGDYRFSNLFKHPTSGWLVDNVIKNVDYSKQDALLADPLDTLRKHETLNMFNTQSYRDTATLISLPLTPAKNNISSLRRQPLRLGYSQYLSLETIGNYYGNFNKYQFNGTLSPNAGNKEIEIRPHYYYVDTKTGRTTPVDVYAPVKGEYKMINDYDESYISNSDEDLYEWMYKLDWQNESVRRMYISEEQLATEKGILMPNSKKEVSAIQENTINIGNADKLFLRASSRSYIGYSDAERQSQRWHFTLGLPSGAVFVKSGEHEISDNTILKDGCVLTTLEIVSKGEVWNLQYRNTLSEKTFSIAPGTHDVTWNDDDEIPVTITSIDKSASNDLDIKGTH